MPERFGDALRKTRRNAEKTLGTSRSCWTSLWFTESDVERGNRRPFSNERILKIARFVKADPTPLIAAADVERGIIEYDITKAKPLEVAVVGGLGQAASPVAESPTISSRRSRRSCKISTRDDNEDAEDTIRSPRGPQLQPPKS